MYVRLCGIDIPKEKWLNYLPTAETLIRLRFAASDLGLRCLPVTDLRVSSFQWVKFRINIQADMIQGTSNQYQRILFFGK